MQEFRIRGKAICLAQVISGPVSFPIQHLTCEQEKRLVDVHVMLSTLAENVTTFGFQMILFMESPGEAPGEE